MQSESTVMALRATGRWTESKARSERRGVLPSRRHPVRGEPVRSLRRTVSNHKTLTTQPPSRSRSSPPLTPLPSNLSPSSYHPTHPRTPLFLLSHLSLLSAHSFLTPVHVELARSPAVASNPVGVPLVGTHGLGPQRHPAHPRVSCPKTYSEPCPEPVEGTVSNHRAPATKRPRQSMGHHPFMESTPRRITARQPTRPQSLYFAVPARDFMTAESVANP